MHARGAPRKSRREVAVGGPLRRAHPASGATWNVQVVRGKMTSRCLWHACRALMIGILLMALGAGMATIGYYAEDLSIGQEVRGNTTVRIKNESRGFHLNNLSYAGPIVMGFGGFIIVAACVMTFEARDSAAKVVPARFKLSTTRTNSSSRRTTDDSGQVNSLYTSKAVASQTNRLENRSEVFSSPIEATVDRETMTATLTNFSKSFGSPRHMCRTRSQPSRRVSRSGSVPNLTTDAISNASMQLCSVSTIQKPYRHRNHRAASTVARYHNIGAECVNPLLADTLHFQRHMLPVANGSESADDYANAKSRINDRTKRSDTAKRHILSRQKPIHKDEHRTPSSLRKRSADVSHLFRRCNKGQSLTHKSSDNSCSAVPSLSQESTVYSTFQQCLSRQISAPLEERVFKSQISINSEPGTSMRTLSCQSSLEPYLQEEESTELDVESHAITNANLPLQIPTTNKSEPTVIHMLECNIENRKLFDNKQKSDNKKKGIYRSNSSRQPTSTPTYGTDFKQSCKDDLGYDSIEVIDERRNKNFEKAGLQRSNTTVIYSEYVP
ncbi:uncharacterized protein LOC119066072 isoform X2 [Bradysia coprophila]|uniref:uncharacterized protein LOC119066072 isoform X2 n=1 Tax=Bradysia coprophila TaxID=38358 RepID=UPI00187DBFDC|nr:uncharacterized protein LOC119066072 isoform X2 [Bradysia coprophila]